MKAAEIPISRPAILHSKKRYQVLGMLSLLSVITYLDRVCISVAGIRIKADLGLTNEQFGWVLAAFAIGYAAFDVPTGALGDRVGPRRVLTRIVIWWSAFTSLTGLAMGYVAMLVIRFLFGAGEAGGAPNSSVAISRWFPLFERGRAQSFIWAASRIGGALAPLLIFPLQMRFGWRVAFYLLGVVGIVWAAIWYWWFRDEPSEMPGISAEEVARIEAARKIKKGHTRLPWKAVVRSWNLWTLLLMYHLYMYGAYFYFSWLQTYLQEGRGFKEKEMAIYGSMPFLFGAVGCLLGGLASDYMVRRIGLKWGRRTIAIVGLALASVTTLSAALAQGQTAVIVLLSLGLACKDFTLPVAWAAAIDIGKDHSGAISGAMNTAGQIGSAIVAVLFGYVVSATHSYNAPLFIISAMLLLSGLLWFRIDPTKSLTTQEDSVAY
jgi:ACS family glucarate transporter-like MFS transporter